MAGNLYILTEADVQRLLMDQRKLDNISGPGVTNAPDSVTINSPAPVRKITNVYSDSAPVGLFAKVVLMYDAAGNTWSDWPTDSEYPAYCTAKTCDSGGNNVAATVDKWVGLNTLAASPNGIITAADQIIAYTPGDDAKAYGAITLSGQAVLGFGCWIDWARWRAV